MSLLLVLLVLLSNPASSLARPRHSITFHSLHNPTSLLYDPSAQHFLLPSASSVSSVSDAGVLQTLNLNPSPSSSPSAIALDIHRRRLLLLLSSPLIAAYDLSSSPPHPRLFLAELPYDTPLHPSAVAVDPSTGGAYVVSNDANIIWRVDVDGKISVLPTSKAFDGGVGLDGIVYVPKGYLLVSQGSTGKLFKVNPEDGTARLVLMNKKIDGLGSLDVRSDGSVMAITVGSAWILQSDDGWSEAAVYDKIAIGEGRLARGLAVRDGRRTYVLHGEEGSEMWKIEEVESEREMGGEWVGALVMMGLALAVFVFWRFQMRQLVSSMNKKIA